MIAAELPLMMVLKYTSNTNSFFAHHVPSPPPSPHHHPHPPSIITPTLTITLALTSSWSHPPCYRLPARKVAESKEVVPRIGQTVSVR